MSTVRFSSGSPSTPLWQVLCEDALLEFDNAKLHKRILHARSAIYDREQEILTDPKKRDLICPLSEVLADGAHLRHLQSPAKLDAEKANAHVPHLPESAWRLFHGFSCCFISIAYLPAFHTVYLIGCELSYLVLASPHSSRPRLPYLGPASLQIRL
jgi:hypothetical protein